VVRATLLGIVTLKGQIRVLSTVAPAGIGNVVLAKSALAIVPSLLLHALLTRLPGAASSLFGVMLASATTFGGMALAMARVFAILVIATVVVILAALFRKFGVVGARVAVAVTVHWFVHACSRNSHLVTVGVNCALLRVVTTCESQNVNLS